MMLLNHHLMLYKVPGKNILIIIFYCNYIKSYKIIYNFLYLYINGHILYIGLSEKFVPTNLYNLINVY